MENLKDLVEYVNGLVPVQMREDVDHLNAIFDRPVYRAPDPSKEPVPGTLIVSTLRSFCEFITRDCDARPDGYQIHVREPWRVELISPITGYHRVREVPIAATYESAAGKYLETWIDLETAIVGLMSTFTADGDRDAVLALLKSITTEDLEIREDDGLAQGVTVKAGVHTKGRATTPNPVMLAPFRAFPELEKQPLSPFVLRLRQGGQVLLKGADGDGWKLAAKEAIAVALERMLSEEHPPILF